RALRAPGPVTPLSDLMLARLRSAALVVALAVAVGCAAPPDDEVLSGIVSQLMVSRPEAGLGQRTFVLSAGGVETEPLFAAAPALTTGDEIAVHGRRLSGDERRGPLHLPSRFEVTSYEQVSQAI